MRITLDVVSGRGAPHTIQLDAVSMDDARQQAVRQGLTVLSCRPAAMGLGQSVLRRRNAERVDVAVFVEQLRDLLVAGLSAIEALDALGRGATGDAATVIERLERQLREGRTLSDALASVAVFPPLLVALVRASELTSDVPQTLTRFLEHQQRMVEVRHRLVSTAIYPALLLGVGALVLAFLMFYVMPRFARVFEGMNGALPWSARAMVAWARFLSEHGPWLWIAGGAAVVVVSALALSPAGRARWLQRGLARTPLQAHLNNYFLSRWYRATGMLVQGGIPLPQALRVANELLPMRLQASGLAVEQGVNEGLSPSAAHVRAGMATPVAEQLLVAGERTGDLGGVLTRIAHFHESDVTRTLERAMRALEPVVMVFIGVGVGLVVVLMYLPIFELASAIQ